LYDAPGRRRWVTVTEDDAARYLLLDGCEEGAMALAGECPVFHYLWFFKATGLCRGEVRRALVLGAGAFTAAKCLALDHPAASVDAVDEEPDLEAVARGYFRLGEPGFAGVRFHGVPAEEFLLEQRPGFDFLFDDLFDGFQHVPRAGRCAEHVRRLRAALAQGGVAAKNVIWSPLRADTRAACAEVEEAWRHNFAASLVVSLGDSAGGHNRILLGWADGAPVSWTAVRERLAVAGFPGDLLFALRPLG
jgi:spermidine synthase